MEKNRSSAKTIRRLKAKYRRNIRIIAILFLILGLVLGFLAGRFTAPTTTQIIVQPTQAPVMTPIETQAPEAVVTVAPEAVVTAVPEAVVTAVPEAVVTATPALVATYTPEPTTTPEPTVTNVAFGKVQEITTVYGGEQLTFTLEVKRSLTPEYYEQHYSEGYRLSGKEAGVEFELMLKDYMGGTSIRPQDLLVFSLRAGNGTTLQGYQLTAAEIGGDEAVVETNIPTLVYKRYDFDYSLGDMKYLVVSDGQDEFLFDLGEPVRPVVTPTPVVTYAPLETGSKGSEVVRLQNQLIEQGYLTGTADGSFGKKTKEAIMKAQAEFEMEETGIADDAFLRKLYGE